MFLFVSCPSSPVRVRFPSQRKDGKNLLSDKYTLIRCIIEPFFAKKVLSVGGFRLFRFRAAFFVRPQVMSPAYFLKKEAVIAAQMFMMKLCIGWCRGCTNSVLFLGKSLIHSMMHLLRSIILSRMDMSCSSCWISSVHKMYVYSI